MRGKSSAGMPRPVSATRNSTWSGAAVASWMLTRPPAGVFLRALSSKLVRIWVTRSPSAVASTGVGGSSAVSATPCASARGSMAACTFCTTSFRSRRVGLRVTCPASNRAKSSNWLTSRAMRADSAWMMLAARVCWVGVVTVPSSNAWLQPCTAVSGVFRSCDTLATKSRWACWLCCTCSTIWLKLVARVCTSRGPLGATRWL